LSKRAKFVDHSTLRIQLASLERSVSGGHEKVDHPKHGNAHDDVSAAVAGVLVVAGNRLGFDASFNWVFGEPVAENTADPKAAEAEANRRWRQQRYFDHVLNGANALFDARSIRNGLMIALLAHCPNRLKNYAALEIGKTFRQIKGRWWITLPGRKTKMGSPEERPIPEWMNPYIDLYLNEARPVLLESSGPPTDALWISSNTGGPMNAGDVGVLITQTTEQTIGTRRHASSCKRIARSQAPTRHRRALQSRK
jgi:hypothetical protein